MSYKYRIQALARVQSKVMKVIIKWHTQNVKITKKFD